MASLFACNNGPAKEEQKADTTAAVAPAPAEVKPAFVPFKVVVVQHKVKNFEKRKQNILGRDSLRNTYGITHYVIGRDAKDSNTVFVIDKIQDVEKAKAFYALPGAKETMKKAGVMDTSRIYLCGIRDRQRQPYPIPGRHGDLPSCKRFRRLEEGL